ncbi:hypothetical protein Dsin_012872 [Dipteronia sinensis]|uniref:Uncharacterized protein n=1 Tax=Dipteronia sinensis TaxID=43782 RepID=A0AAE0E8V7_9ROSI|nr:hypothetical protein Dsin_012872 [Dipteronia sinensis]
MAYESLPLVKLEFVDGLREVVSHLKAYERAQNMLKDLESDMMNKEGARAISRVKGLKCVHWVFVLFGVMRGIICDIHELCCKFWWGSTERDRKLHWASWFKLCKEKSEGGMRFRDL